MPSYPPLLLSLLHSFDQLSISESWVYDPVGRLFELEWGRGDDGCSQGGNKGRSGFEWRVDERKTVGYCEGVESIFVEENSEGIDLRGIERAKNAGGTRVVSRE